MSNIINFYDNKPLDDLMCLEQMTCARLRRQIEQSLYHHYNAINANDGIEVKRKLFNFYRLLNYRSFDFVLVKKKKKLSRLEIFKEFIGWTSFKRFLSIK